jgi:general secretion pathway protein E
VKQLTKTNEKIESCCEYVDKILPEQLNPELVRKLPLEFLKKQCAIPIDTGDGRVAVAMAEDFNIEAYDAISAVLSQPCRRVICPAFEIEQAISRCYYQIDSQTPALQKEQIAKTKTDKKTESALSKKSETIIGQVFSPRKLLKADLSITDESEKDRDTDSIDTSNIQTRAEDLLSIANKEPIIKLVNKVFFDAVHRRASDIHIESCEKSLRIRYRIDGVLHNVLSLSKAKASAVISRLKIMSNLDIAERRLPQDGQSRVKIGDNLIDIRVSVIPTLGGERVVLRLLDKQSCRLSLEQIGFSGQLLESFRTLVNSSHGIILLTGPTGSGKTTTLYAALNELNCEQLNILTVEDPIEYQLAGIGQMQIRPKIGLTFANCLRHILRQDPNVIMVGEIRDTETARIAIQASLTGHLVLSTLHTNDSASAITRLIDMGIEPYLISSSVIAVMAQRLVRVICPGCKTQYKVDDRILSMFGTESGKLINKGTLYEGRGCEQCLKTGFIGRTGIFELLTIDDEIKQFITQRSNCHTIKEHAINKGMKTLRDDGLDKVLKGQTSLEELCRVTYEHIPADKKETECVAG